MSLFLLSSAWVGVHWASWIYRSFAKFGKFWAIFLQIFFQHHTLSPLLLKLLAKLEFLKLSHKCLRVCPTATLWLPDAKSWLNGKDRDAGKDWRQEEIGVTEDEMVGWHHWLNGHDFEKILGAGEGQGGLTCSSPWGPKESDMTEQLNNNPCIIQIE